MMMAVLGKTYIIHYTLQLTYKGHIIDVSESKSENEVFVVVVIYDMTQFQISPF